MTEPQIEIREVGKPPRVVVVDHVLEIGRDRVGVTIVDDGVSRRHLKLLPSPLGLQVVDLGSRNGTLLNGVPVAGQTNLADGDVLRVGRTDLIVRLPQAAQPVAAGLRLRAHDSVGEVPAPPPLVVPPRPPSAAGSLVRRVLTGAETDPVFRTYTELPKRVPIRVWRAVRVVSVASYLTLAGVLLVWPDTGLRIFFGIVIPLLPALFFLAPGVWRNICPLSSANQSARVLGFSLGRTAPTWMRERGYLLAISLFFGIAGARLAVFNDSGTATAVLLLCVIGSAFAGGVLFKGKSGWCSSICPLLPVQRLYGQTPFVLSPNSHCQPCLACTRNCYDFQPQLAQQADLHDPDLRWQQPRRLFASALPGFVLGFFLLLDQPELGTADTYARLAVYVAVSVGGAFATRGVPRAVRRARHGALGCGRAQPLLLVRHAARRGRRLRARRSRRPLVVALAGRGAGPAPDVGVAGADLVRGASLPRRDRRRAGDRPWAAGGAPAGRSLPHLLRLPRPRSRSPTEGRRFRPGRARASWSSPRAAASRSRRVAGWVSAARTPWRSWPEHTC